MEGITPLGGGRAPLGAAGGGERTASRRDLLKAASNLSEDVNGEANAAAVETLSRRLRLAKNGGAGLGSAIDVRG